MKKVFVILQYSALKSTIVPATSPLPYACFWTSWLWNKDTALLCSIRYCTVHRSSTTCRGCTHVTNVCQTGELTYNVGHAEACPHLWKFMLGRFICRELTVPCGLGTWKTLSKYLLNEWTWSLVPLLPAGKFSVRKETAKQTFLWHFLGILRDSRVPEDASLSPQRERAGHSAP